MTQSEYTKYTERCAVLKERIVELESMNSKREAIALVIEEARAELSRIDDALCTRRVYAYTLEGGEWNTEYAYTVEEAQAMAARRWDGLSSKPLWDSFMVCSLHDRKRLMANN